MLDKHLHKLQSPDILSVHGCAMLSDRSSCMCLEAYLLLLVFQPPVVTSGEVHFGMLTLFLYLQMETDQNVQNALLQGRSYSVE